MRGVGEAALETMFDARRSGGGFRDLFDFASRVDAKRLNKGVLEALVQCGAFDSVIEPLAVHRSRAFATIDRVLERSRSAEPRPRERSGQHVRHVRSRRQALERREGGAERLPRGRGLGPDGAPEAGESRARLLRLGPPAVSATRASSDASNVVGTIKLADQTPWSIASVAGMVENYQEKLFKGGAGGRAAFFDIEDMVGRVKAKIRNDKIELFAALLTSGDPVLLTGKVSFPMTEEPTDEEREPTLLVDQVERLSEVALRATRAVSIRLDAERTQRRDLLALKDLLALSPGECPVELVLMLADGAEAVLDLQAVRVAPSDALLGGLERVRVVGRRAPLSSAPTHVRLFGHAGTACRAGPDRLPRRSASYRHRREPAAALPRRHVSTLAVAAAHRLPSLHGRGRAPRRRGRRDRPARGRDHRARRARGR